MHLSAHPRHTIAAAVTAIAVAACGSSGGNTNTGGGSPGSSGSQASGAKAAYEYSACMRTHGVTGFPDPIIHSTANSESIGLRVTPAETGSPSFKSAEKACAGILPLANGSSSTRQGPSLAEFVAFARCLRGHGYQRFPDPNSQGQLPPQEITAAGINVNAPGFTTAARTCLPALKGSVTAAQLAQAIHHIGAQQGTVGGAAPSSG
jgi:hypothetical protein